MSEQRNSTEQVRPDIGPNLRIGFPCGPVGAFLVMGIGILGLGGGLITSLTSCQNDEPDQVVHWADSLSFNTGFPLTGPLSGVFNYSDSTGSHEVVYFADAVTQKKLLLFSPTGLPLRSVPLNEALDSLDQVGGLSVLSLDTFAFTGIYNDRIGLFDGRGHCINLFDAKDHLTRPNGLKYELWCSLSTPFLIGNCACFQVELVSTSTDGYIGVDAPKVDDEYRYYWLQRNGPKFAAMTLGVSGEKWPVRWDVSNETKDTTAPIPVTPEIGSYALTNGLWFQYSIYSPVINVVDPLRMRSVRHFEVHSKYTPTFNPPIEIAKGASIRMQDSIDDRFQFGAGVQTIRYDPTSKLYLVLLRQPCMKPANVTAHESIKKYELVAFDGSFSPVKDMAFTDGTHVLPMMLNLTSGSYVLRHEDKRTQMNGNHVFDKIDLDSN